jgi:hypothetical protein
MEFLEAVLTGMKEQEIREFRYFLNRHPQNTGSTSVTSRRDLHLLELIRTPKKGGDEISDTARLIYQGEKDRNAYHQLRNRLKKSLEEFLFFESSRRSEDYEIRKLIEISRYFFARKWYDLGQTILEKAENMALQSKSYTELGNIYNLLILNAAYIPTLSLNDLLEKRRKNNLAVERSFHIHYLLGQVRQLLASSDTFQTHIDVDYAINRLLLQNGITDDSPEHAPLWIQVITMVGETLLQQGKSSLLEQYLVLKYPELEEKGVLSAAGTETRFRVLWAIVALVYQNRNFSRIEKFLFDLKYEAGKRKETRPEWMELVAMVEIGVSLETGQLARAKQIFNEIADRINPLRKHWVLCRLAAANPTDYNLFQCLQEFDQKIDSGTISNSVEAFAFQLDVLRCRIIAEPNIPYLQLLEEIKTSHKIFLQHPESEEANRFLEWVCKSSSATTTCPTLKRLPEPGDLRFLPQAYHWTPFIR